MTERCCRTCYWWSNAQPPLATGVCFPAGSNPDIGTCHVMPPTLIRAPIPMSMFPSTHADRHCAEWQPSDGPDDGAREDVHDDTVVPFKAREAA